MHRRGSVRSRLPTLITPASFNSRLGVIRTINEHLEPSHEAFVVEMGMYRKGDIAELCELVHPRIGVLTAIGPMHLERLGSIEAIADAKSELARALPTDGHLVANGDDPRVRAIAAQRRGRHGPVRAGVRRRARCRPSRSRWPTGGRSSRS